MAQDPSERPRLGAHGVRRPGTGPREPSSARRVAGHPAQRDVAAPGVGRDVVGLVVGPAGARPSARPRAAARRAPRSRPAPCGCGRRIVAARPGTMWSTIRSRACSRSSASSTTPRLADDDGGAVVHRALEARAGRDQAVDLGDRHADRACRARPPATWRRPSRGGRACRPRRAVGVDGERRGQHERVAAGVHPDVRDQRRVEQGEQLARSLRPFSAQPAERGPRRSARAGSVTSRVGRRRTPRPARARSCGRGSTAVPHSSAKIAPSTNIIGTTKPSADRGDLDHPAERVGPLAAQHARPAAGRPRPARARPHSAVPSGDVGDRDHHRRGQAEGDRLEAEDRGAHAAPRRPLRRVGARDGSVTAPPSSVPGLADGDHRAGDQHGAGADRRRRTPRRPRPARRPGRWRRPAAARR